MDFQEGPQVTLVLVTTQDVTIEGIEQALTDPARRARLGDELAERCQKHLDERLHLMWYAQNNFQMHAGGYDAGSQYATGWRFGAVFFVINLPFYLLALRAMGWTFTVKTFCAVGLLSLYSELLPQWISIERIHPLFAAVIGGLLAGAGLLMLIRHQARLGGLGVMAIYLQKTKGWRAGNIQMVADGFIVLGALLIVDIEKVALSILGAFMLNLVLTINHKPGRYFGQ